MFVLLVDKYTTWRRWQPTPVLLSGKSHGRRSLVGYSPGNRKESVGHDWATSLSNTWRHLFLILISGSKNKHPLFCFLRLLLIKPLVKCVESRSDYSSPGNLLLPFSVILFMARNFPAGVPGDNSHVRAKGKYHSSSDGAVIYKMQIVFVLPVEVILNSLMSCPI